MKLSEFVAIKQNYLQIGDISERAIETFSYSLCNFGIDNETSRGIMEIGLIRWLAVEIRNYLQIDR